MAAITTIQHKRRSSSSFSGGDLATAEIGVDTANKVLYYSTDGSDLVPIYHETGVSQIFISAGEMVARSTNGAIANSYELPTNDIMVDSFEFDNATEQGVGFWTNFSDIWNAGTVKAKVYWTADNGTGDVDWTIKARSYGNDEAIDQALPTGVTVTDVLLATDDLHISDATAPITVAGADNSEPVYFEITRPTSDTHNGTVRLLGVSIQFTENLAWQGGTRNFNISADAFIPRETDGAAYLSKPLATNNLNVGTYNFDTTVEEGVGTWIHLGNGWDAGTLKFKAHWTATGGSAQSVKWDFAARAYANDDVLDQALGTEQSVTDTWIADNDLHISDATPALTVAGTPAAGQPIYLQVTRDVGDVADTLDVDAQLIAVTIEYLNVTGEPSAW